MNNSVPYRIVSCLVSVLETSCVSSCLFSFRVVQGLMESGKVGSFAGSACVVSLHCCFHIQ